MGGNDPHFAWLEPLSDAPLDSLQAKQQRRLNIHGAATLIDARLASDLAGLPGFDRWIVSALPASLRRELSRLNPQEKKTAAALLLGHLAHEAPDA